MKFETKLLTLIFLFTSLPFYHLFGQTSIVPKYGIAFNKIQLVKRPPDFKRKKRPYDKTSQTFGIMVKKQMHKKLFMQVDLFYLNSGTNEDFSLAADLDYNWIDSKYVNANLQFGRNIFKWLNVNTGFYFGRLMESQIQITSWGTSIRDGKSEYKNHDLGLSFSANFEFKNVVLEFKNLIGLKKIHWSQKNQHFLINAGYSFKF